jgi:catechol 2,3-dioxygenase
VRLQVADLGRSLEWYRRVLGFVLLDEKSGNAALGATGADQPLVELSEHRGALPPPRRGRLGLFHYAILLPDRAALGRFLSHQIELDTPLGASDHLVSEALYLNDPDGLGIEVYRDRPRSEWQRHGRELAMATLPLDDEGVLASSGGKWEGMPAGTTIGHVHLHVGDLSAASRFYHDGLGLDLMVWGYPGALFLAAGGYHHHLGVNTWAGPDAAPPRPDDARLLEWELVLPAASDVASLARALGSAGQAPGDSDRGLVVRDPWGTALRVRSQG